MEETKKGVFGWIVLLAGFFNAGGMAVQAVKLFQTQNPAGFSAIMFFVFLGIQLVYAINGVRHKDAMQAAGMFTSMIPTSAIIIMIFTF